VSYLDTIKVEKLTNKFVVCCGYLGSTVGDKHDYFRYDDARNLSKREAEAYKLLGKNRFPQRENLFDTEDEAEAYADEFRRYVKAVIALPDNLKAGHSCQFWK
jgi:hypothetical protein